jgi:sulfhydrogenase subunit beta (sulfur reductase)
MRNSSQSLETGVVERDQLHWLLDALVNKGYRVLGPTVRDQAILYDDFTSFEDAPVGWTDEQDGGTYRLKKRADKALFGYTNGPTSPKKFLHPSVVRLWRAKAGGNGFEMEEGAEEAAKLAFIGVRSCELHAIAVQDRVFLEGKYSDPIYKARRQDNFIVAVNCGHAGGTCFCVSMNTGPKATSGFDLALTEVLEPKRHYFVAEVGSRLGREVLDKVPHKTASAEEKAKAESIVAKTARQMGRSMDTKGIKELLYRNYENPRWDEVAKRCLTCGNCTMVCPTCFCTTVEDVTDLAGEHIERWRKLDSCFTMDFSYIHGGSVRSSTRARYRQWMAHKIATWIDQFGTSGCVGCGRCITWCPVGIDITEEAGAIRQSEKELTERRTNHGRRKP